MYFVYPQGTPSHTATLEARLAGVTSPPFIPAGMTIEWRQDGATIKSGPTDDLGNLSINTGAPGDVNFDATDTGSVIDFIIDGTTFGNPVVLSNQGPSLVGATVETDGYGRSETRPTFVWTFSDPDGDPQFFYRIKIGTGVGLGNVFDSGQVLSADEEFTLPDAEPALPAGANLYWRIEASDGEKTNPLDPDSTTDRVVVSASGTLVVNIPPVVSDVKIDGTSGGSDVESFEPVISWTYFDADGQPQQAFQITVSENSDLSDPVWESIVFSSSQTQATFNFDFGAASELSPHVVYTVGVKVFDTLDESVVVKETFQISNKPRIVVAFVDDKINPTNLSILRPTFTWEVFDPDGDEIRSFDLRVGDDDTDLGTDSFVGNIWHISRVTPEAFETTLGEDGTAFSGCIFPKELVSGVKYFFQVKAYDDYGPSDWFTGCFKLNDAPVAENLSIVPSAPYTSDDLSALWDFVDDAGETESPLSEVRWFKDGVEVVSARNLRVLPASFTRPFEEWNFSVRPHDGVEFGAEAVSASVIIANRAPVASSLAIRPAQPKTDDALEALFAVNDPDGDEVTVRIKWFKDGIEQPKLRNKRIVPPFLTSVGEEWYFTVDPTDGYTAGATARSPSVEILNTRPEVTAIMVDNMVLPDSLDNPNPVISWQSFDPDAQDQAAYHVVIGTTSFRTKKSNAASPNALVCGDDGDGIVSSAANGEIVSGDDVFDSGVIPSGNKFFQYVTDDFLPGVSVGATDAVQYSGYRLEPDVRTISLVSGASSGSVLLAFPGLPGTYEAQISYIDEDDKRSSFEILVDGIPMDKFTTAGQEGTFSHTFKAANISATSSVSIRGTAVDANAKAAFTRIVFNPVLEFEQAADEFDVLSGYVSDGDGGIKLVGLAGTALLSFPFPTGTYDIELVYQTESSGSPTMSVSVNNSVIDSFSFETGVKTRSRFISNISLSSGDSFKINAARGGAASARVKKIVFRPVQTVQAGTKLRPGVKYYVSIRVFDGEEWSDWKTSRFTVEGSAWVSSVQNATGWTIEARFALLQGAVQEEEETQAATETAATTTEPTVLDTLIDALQTAQAAQQTQATPAPAPAEVCGKDAFQGLRFYDGTAFGWMRLKPDKVELLVSEPLEYELDGTEQHTFRITAIGNDIKLYVDNELVIDGTGKFTRPTSRKLLEFGDIAGRKQTHGSEWESFRYSINGAFAPSALVDYSLDEIQSFADASVGRMKAYKDSLYVSVDPNDPDESSAIYRFDEGYEPEQRSVLAITRSTVTSVVVDPLRNGNLFDSSGKFLGTHIGLQYLIGSKPFPFDLETNMTVSPSESGDWEQESTCDGDCETLFSDILVIDTTGESGEKFHKYTQRKDGDLWVDSADNEKGWTVEARVKIATDGSGDSLDASSAFIEGTGEDCDPAQGLSNDVQTIEPPEDDGLDAPGIFINDGTYQEVVQLFSTGVRLKYARLFAEQTLNDQFYTIRVIGKGRGIAVYAKGDNDRFFRRLIFAAEGLFVPSQPVGDHELPCLAIDRMGISNVAYQDSRDGDWGIFYTKALPKEIVARGSGMFSADHANFDKFVQARPGFGLPPDSSGVMGSASLFSGGASFVSWGVQPGDFLFVFSKNDSETLPRKLAISAVPHETILEVSTEEDLSDAYNGAEYVIMRGEETWLPPIRVSPQTMDSLNPRLILTSNVEAFVAYENFENGSAEIYARRGVFDPFYMDFRDTVRVTNSIGESSKPDIAQLESGDLFIVWQDSRNDPNGSQIFFSQISQANFGVLDEYENVLATPDAKRARNARVAAIGSKAFIVYEDDHDDDGDFDVFAVEVSNKIASDPIQLSGGAGNSTRPCITATSKDVYVAYEDDGLGAKEIYAIKGANAGTSVSWGSPVRITDSRGQSERADIKSDDNGNVWIVFQDDRNRAGYADLYAAKYDAVLKEWLSSAQRGLDIRVDTYVTQSCNPSLDLDRFGNLGIVWEAAKEGELKKLAKVSLDGVVTMDRTVAAYMPLDDNASSTVVQNKIRKERGSLVPPAQVVFLVNKSSEMNSGSRFADAKSVVSSTIASLSESDQFNIILFNEGTQSFQSEFVLATDDNKTAADTFLNAASASGTRDLNQAISAAFAQDFATDLSARPMVAIVDTGSAEAGEATALASANSELEAAVLVFGVEAANQSVLLSLVEDDDDLASFLDDFDDLGDAFSDFFSKFSEQKDSVVNYDFAYEPQSNGTAFDFTDLYHVGAPDDGVSQRNPSTQGAFDLNANGKGFSVSKDLLSSSGAIDLWLSPHWVSTDITERVIFGNAAPGTTDPNSIVFGVRPATSGNDLFLRIVDELGNVRETFVNNDGVGDPKFDWDIDQLVHLRAVWDQNAVGISTLRGVSFASATIGYACAENGLIWKTEDSGATWSALKTGVTYELYSIDFIDATTGWACGEFGTVLKTTDGATWEQIDTGFENDLTGIYFRTSSIGYACGSGGLLLRSTDGGDTWTQVSSGTTEDFKDIGLASGASSVVVAVGSGNSIYRSTSDGASYSQVSSLPKTANWEAVSRTHQGGTYSTYVVGNAGAVIKTDDLGATWSDVTFDWEIGYLPNLLGVSHGPDSDYVYVVGQNGGFAGSTDGGATFSRCETAVKDGSFRAIDANLGGAGDNLSLVAVGVGGTVMYSDAGGIVQHYAITRCGNMTIFIDGIEADQQRVNDGPFSWDPTQADADLVFGDFEESGSRTANAVFDEVVIYSAPPPNGALFRQKSMWIFQAEEAKLLITKEQEKKIEWGDISQNVLSKSFWTSFRMFLCGAKEPLQVFQWNTQLGLVNDVVNDLALDKRGRLWAATEHGISAFDTNSANDDIERWLGGRAQLPSSNDRFVNYTNIVDGLVADEVSTIAVDDGNNVWAGTSRGLMLLENTSETFSDSAADPVSEAEGLAFSEEVANAEPAQFRIITEKDGLPSNRILVVEALQGAVFVGTDKGLAVIRTEQQVVGSSSTTTESITETVTSSTTSSGTQDAFESSESSSQTTTRLDLSNISIFTVKDGLPSNRIQAIAQERRSGDIWIGTDRGLARFFPDGSISYDKSSGLLSADIFSITIDGRDRKYAGTGFGITRVDGLDFESFQPSEGIGFGAVLDGDEDGVGTKWFAMSDGLLEMDESCSEGVRFVKYDINDGIIGQPGVTDFEKYRILGGDVPSGGCNKALVSVAINGELQGSGFDVNPFFPMVSFDQPRTPSDKVEVCVHRGWRKTHDFGFDPNNPESQTFLQTELSRFLVFRKRFGAGDVILGANFARGASNLSTSMYTVLVAPVDEEGDDEPVSSVSAPSGTALRTALKGTNIYADDDDDITIIPAGLVGTQLIALPSADASRTDEEYLEFTISEDSFVYVAYDSRATSLPGWLRSFERLPAVFRVTDMDTFVDATNQEKLFASVAGTAGCVFDVLKDPDACDISDQIALDGEAPDGCATIARLNSTDELVLNLTATDSVTGVTNMQVSAFENFTEDGETEVDQVPFQPLFNLTLPVEAVDPVATIEDSEPPDNNPLDDESFPDIEYSIVFNLNGRVILGTKNPGRVFEFDKGTEKVSFLFDTGEDEVLSMAQFGSDLIVGTGGNGRAFRWDGTTLSQIILPSPDDQVTSLAAFDSRVFFGTAPNGKIFEMNEAGQVSLFMDTNESSVDGFAIFAGQLYWVTSNDQIEEGDVLSLTTREGHRHSITVPAGATRISELNGTTTEVDGHTHAVVNGVVQPAAGHDHQVNGSRSGKVFRLNIATDLTTIVHSDRDFSVTSIVSTSIENEGLMFVGTFPNGKILRFVPEEAVFIKSFDTPKDRVNRLKSIGGVVYAVVEDDIFFFDGRRWQFFASVSDEILDLFELGDDILVVRKDSLGKVGQVNADGTTEPRTLCAYVRFYDAAGNKSSVRDSNGNIIDCYRPCITVGGTAGDGTGTGADGATTGVQGDLDGDGVADNPLLAGAHRIVEVNSDARSVFVLNGPEPFLSGNRVEEEVGVYYSEVFNGTTSLVQWRSLSWEGTAPVGTSITIAVRTANTSAEIDDAEFGDEFTDSSGNDLTNLTGQFLQFRATLKVTAQGVASPELDKVDILLRTSQATHYFTTNFSLPDDLQRGILTYNGCLNPPATDIVFGVTGKDSVDFSDYFVITPNRVFEFPSEHQTKNLRVGIKFISSPDQVPVVDEFALLFSLANDAFIRLNIDGQPGETSPPSLTGTTRTVVTEQVQGHTHTVTFPSTTVDKFAINGQTSINAGHSHEIINGVIQPSAGHTHDFDI